MAHASFPRQWDLHPDGLVEIRDLQSLRRFNTRVVSGSGMLVDRTLGGRGSVLRGGGANGVSLSRGAAGTSGTLVIRPITHGFRQRHLAVVVWHREVALSRRGWVEDVSALPRLEIGAVAPLLLRREKVTMGGTESFRVLWISDLHWRGAGDAVILFAMRDLARRERPEPADDGEGGKRRDVTESGNCHQATLGCLGCPIQAKRSIAVEKLGVAVDQRVENNGKPDNAVEKRDVTVGKLRFAMESVQIRDRLEDGGDHQVGHGADEAGHDDEDHGHDERHDALKALVELLVVTLGGAAQGVVDAAGLFADGNHVNEQRRESAVADEGF
jgi:hypothetical protein